MRFLPLLDRDPDTEVEWRLLHSKPGFGLPRTDVACHDGQQGRRALERLQRLA